ncbi:hypothetical protein NPIL_345731, partial [Nephila pilipes]
MLEKNKYVDSVHCSLFHSKEHSKIILCKYF